MREQEIKTAAKMPGRVAYFDVLNILATISVVWIHFGNEVHWYDGSQVWYWCLFIQVVCYWAVPVFFMLTGATLMNYREKYSTKEFFIHRVKRGLLPYLIFGGALALRQILKGNLAVDAAHPLLSVLDIFMNTRMEHIYWFFLVLFGIYLAMPALSVFAKPENRKQLDYLVIVGIATVSVLPFLARGAQHLFGMWGIFPWNTALELPVLGSYLIYPVLGYWASTREFTRQERMFCYAGAVSSAILRFAGLKLLSERDGVTNQLFMDYRSFPSLFLALGVFVFVRYAVSDRAALSNRWKKMLKELSACSLGVYLIHRPVMAVMEKTPFFAKYSVQWYFVWPFVCYVGCVAVVFFGRVCLKRLRDYHNGTGTGTTSEKNKCKMPPPSSHPSSADTGPSAYLCVCAALVAIYGIWQYFSVKNQQLGSFLALPVFFAYRSGYQTVLSAISQNHLSRRKPFFLLTGGLTLLFSLCMTWGSMLDANNVFSPAWDCAVMAFCLFFALYPCIWFVTRKLDDFVESAPSQSAVPANPRLIRNTKRICFAVIVVIWLLIYLGMYPGLYGYDAPSFIQQHMNDTIPVRTYPAYTTVFYKLFSLGLNLGGSYESGLALAMALQGMLSLFGIWRVLCFLETYIHSVKTVVFAALFYTLLPTHAILSFSSATDAPFTVFFSMCVIHSVRMVLDRNAYWKDPKNWLALGMWMVLLCLIRENGIYVLLVFAVFIPFYPKKTRVKTIVVLLSAVLTFQTCQGAIKNYYGITPQGFSSLSPMLTIPVQQIACVHESAHNKLTEEEWNVVYRYIPSDMFYIYNYQPCISDGLMRAKNEELLAQDPGTFLKMYITVLTRAPVECLQAGLLSCIGLWYPDKYYSDWRMYHPFIEYQMWSDGPEYEYRPEWLVIHRQSKLPFVDKKLSELYGEVRAEGVPVEFDDIPIFSAFTRIGLYFFAAIYVFFYLLYRKRFFFLPCIGLTLGIVACVVLGPVTFYRYSAPMIFSAPSWLTTLFVLPSELDVPAHT